MCCTKFNLIKVTIAFFHLFLFNVTPPPIFYLPSSKRKEKKNTLLWFLGCEIVTIASSVILRYVSQKAKQMRRNVHFNFAIFTCTSYLKSKPYKFFKHTYTYIKLHFCRRVIKIYGGFF